jgi:2-polyprenyl-6-methoxyphenol hydroxylase-like FAD-dependent oxidoreductase
MADPIIIAGGGPAGLLLAHELRLWDVPVVVLEKSPEHPGYAVGQALNTTAAEVLDQRGLLAALQPHVLPTQGTHFSLIWLDRGPLTGRHMPALVLGQHHVERELERRAVAGGADLRRGHRLTGFQQDADGVTVDVTGPGGDYRLRGSHLVGADGQDSVVRSLAGIGFPAAGRPSCGLVADVDADIEDWPDAHRGSKFSPIGGCYSAVTTQPGVVRVVTAEFDAEPPSGDNQPTIEDLAAACERLNGEPFPDVPVRWIRWYGGPTGVAERYQNDRVHLVGDAAHTFYPLAGLRLNLCFQDALNLGWKLAADVQGWAPPGLLSTYETERRPQGVRAAEATEAQLSLIYPADRAAPIRALIIELLKLPDVNRHLLELSSGLDVAYAAAPLGRRLPHVALTTPDGDTSVAGIQHSGRGVLLDMSGSDDAPAAVAPWRDRIRVVRAEPVEAIADPIVLLRPDGHVVWLGSAPDDDLQTALKQWFGEPADTTR